jgi:GWxTD domain-containing protein
MVFRWLVVLVVGSAACAAPGGRPAAAPGATAGPRGSSAGVNFDLSFRAGQIVATGGVPFVATVRSLGTASPDTSLAIIAMSIPPRALTFTRDGERYRATYDLTIEIRRDSVVTSTIRRSNTIVVAHLLETSRADEGVLFQQFVPLAPGSYALTLTVVDGGTKNQGIASTPFNLPRYADGSVSSPFAVYRAGRRPSRTDDVDVIVSPRAIVQFGRDSLVSVYLESYGARAPAEVIVTARPDRNTIAYRDTVSLSGTTDMRSAVVTLPVARLGVGIVPLVVTSPGGRFHGTIPIIVSLGDDIPVASFSELVDLLRYFVTEERVRPLRDSVPERRAAAWAELFQSTDPAPATPENEALREYFRRVQLANSQFRELTLAGWQTDRGIVLLTLGEPDLVTEPTTADAAALGRTLTWDFRRHHVVLTFVDATGFGRWRLTPASESEFQGMLRTLGPCVGCR